jgi:ribosomal protein S18 acetylase RimI-like enzyme
MTIPQSRPSPAHPLDDIIWKALTTRQEGLARIRGPARKFIDDVGPLAAFTGDPDKGYEALADLGANGCTIAVFLAQEYQPRDGWTEIARAPLIRMVRQNRVPYDVSPVLAGLIAPLGDADSNDMQELAHLAKPGPFGPRTHQLGSFFGIRRDGRLVAMAGERMKVPGYTEVSAVCTHPDFNGKGYAAALMMQVIKGIEGRGETAFLHSRADNDRAVSLYERLGFVTCWSGHFVALKRA